MNRHGGDVTVVHLPEIGIRGNTHFPMSDMNNLQIADQMSKFLSEKKLDFCSLSSSESSKRLLQRLGRRKDSRHLCSLGIPCCGNIRLLGRLYIRSNPMVWWQ